MMVPTIWHPLNQPADRMADRTGLVSLIVRRLALLLKIILLMNLLKMPGGAHCKPTSGMNLQQVGDNSALNPTLKPVNSVQPTGLSRQHEGLLVDLLNEQQSDFIAKLNRADRLGGQSATGSGPLAETKLNRPQQANQQGDWIPVAANNQVAAESQTKASRQMTAQPCDKKSKSRVAGQRLNQQLAVAATSSVRDTAGNSTVTGDHGRGESDEGEEEEDDDDANEPEGQQQRKSSDSLDGHESVALESALMPPPPPPPPPPPYRGHRYEGDERSDDDRTQTSNNNMNNPNEPDDDEGPAPAPEGASDSSLDTPPDEAAARREQEAAEASEAEAADRSALAEQQAAQREIILAQAQSEARAIREQQEALLRQQQLQQQILMRRHQNFLDDTDPATASEKRKEKKRRGGDEKISQQRPRGSSSNAQKSPASRNRHMSAAARQRSAGDRRHHQRQMDSYHGERGLRAQGSSNQQHQAEHQRDDNSPPPFNLMDNQFSDQPDTGIVDRGHSSTLMNSARTSGPDNPATHAHNGDQAPGEELGSEDSVRRPQYLQSQSDDSALEAALALSADNLSIGARLNLTTSDLLAAAQHHHYGAHYGSLGGHHKAGHYYQYAESNKKGQFDSGFKRGNKKFVISSRSSQHKGHASGHMNWHGKKGKGSHYWDYKHKNKKHYGGGDGYGGGHHYY